MCDAFLIGWQLQEDFIGLSPVAEEGTRMLPEHFRGIFRIPETIHHI